MGSWVHFLRSSIGKKVIMGLTGLVWVGFVFTHMLGNMLLLVPDGGKAYNHYAYGLASIPELLYAAEGVLVLSILLHVFMAMLITAENKAARPIGYSATPNGSKASTVASKTMIYSGSIILFFLIFHLITFKFGTYYSTNSGGVEMRDLSKLVIEKFQNPGYVIGYIICLVLLGFHLSHGFQAAFQSLGFRHPKYTKPLKALAVIYSVVVIGGFISQPIYAYFFAG